MSKDFPQFTPMMLETDKGYDTLRPWLYDLVLWLLSVTIDLFFREVHPRSSWKIPKTGPVIFVAAPHANQFVDSLILMRLIRLEAHRRVAFLIAAASLKRKWVGALARAMGSVGVGRALDNKIAVPGTVYLPDPEGEPTLVKGVGTDFLDNNFTVGAVLVLPPAEGEASATAEIVEIVSAQELRVKKAFKGDVAYKQLTGRKPATENGLGMDGNTEKQGLLKSAVMGTPYKIAPKVDQSKVYDAVFKLLGRGGCVGIFPEGGSHDRTELLPLKAGVAIMALGAVAADPTCNVKIVPCGMNYFHAHKFRSRAVVEFGTPLEVPPELVEEYKNGSRRVAIGQMLEMVYNSLVAVTVTSPDYDTLMLIQAVRRLYNPNGRPLPLPMVVELNRRLVKGYTRYKDDPRIVSLKKNVMDYHRQLLALNVRDHQLDYAKFTITQVVAALMYRVTKLLLLSAGVLPGLILFAPVFIAGKLISIRKAREALAASTVKVQARDVVATWKILVAMGLAPALYAFYSISLAWWTYYNRVQGYMPDWVSLWSAIPLGFIVFPSITYAALRFGEIGMDIAKSLRPLVLALNPSSDNTLVILRKKRADLSKEVTDLINELGPELFPDFEKMRIINDPDLATPTSPSSPPRPRSRGREKSWAEMFYRSGEGSPVAGHGRNASGTMNGGSSMTAQLPRNESFRNLSNIGLFASGPHTPSTDSPSRSSSRPRSNGGIFGGLGGGFSRLDESGALDDVSKRIRGAMQERGLKRRRSERQASGTEDMVADAMPDYTSDADSSMSGATTPGSEQYEMKKVV